MNKLISPIIKSIIRKQIKIDIISDIHLEFYNNSFDFNNIITNSQNAHILVLAGDIGYPRHENYINFLKYVSEQYEHVIMVTGNHEYYTGIPIIETDNMIHQLINDNNLPNVHFLNNKTYVIDNINFIGTTLWIDVPDCSDGLINDSHYIYPFNNKELGKANDFRKLFQQNIQFINNSLIINNTYENVIITHHLPSFECIHLKDKQSGKINNWFASNCDSILQNEYVKLWICGHTHSSINMQLFGCKIIANPLGYPIFNRIGKLQFENDTFEKYVETIYNSNI